MERKKGNNYRVCLLLIFMTNNTSFPLVRFDSAHRPELVEGRTPMESGVLNYEP
jgi:hypothetical protein